MRETTVVLLAFACDLVAAMIAGAAIGYSIGIALCLVLRAFGVI